MIPDASVVAQILELLRSWGWEQGLERVKAALPNAADERERAAQQFFIGWLACERGLFEEALTQFQALVDKQMWAGWSLFGQAMVAMRRHDFQSVYPLLKQAGAQASPADEILHGAIAHLRGATHFHDGIPIRQVLPDLNFALERFGRHHFGTGRVLDTLGMVQAARDNFTVALEFYEQALVNKQRFDDREGIALTHGQLGRLYLSWGILDKAEEHFRKDLRISREIHDFRGRAQMHNALGQVHLARKQWPQAHAELALALELCRGRPGWERLLGYALKDSALAFLGEGKLDEAEALAKQAEEFLTSPETQAHLKRAWGLIQRSRKKHVEAAAALTDAFDWFQGHQEGAEAARTQLELARALRDRDPGLPEVTRHLLESLQSAEKCRRPWLAREIEAELREANPQAYYRCAYQRVRGHGISEDAISATQYEILTVLFLDLKGSTAYAQSNDPELVLITSNQIFADLVDVLENHDITVNQYLGDGFMALVRGHRHAYRAVAAAQAMQEALREFNQPRRVLGLTPLLARIGINTGGVCLGNIGTYRKTDFTAVGAATNMAARLQHEAQPDGPPDDPLRHFPCISKQTFLSVENDFEFQNSQGRVVSLKGLGDENVWDVVGLRNY